jgi:transcriptional regulator with XRE-family HTH domain
MPRHYTKSHSKEMALFLKKLGGNVKSHRNKQGLSQAKLAEMAGMDIRHYQDIEAGNVLSLRPIWTVAKALDVPIATLTCHLGPGGTKPLR